MALNKHRSASRRALLPLGLAVASCGDLGFVSGVVDKRPFSPPPEYREWWASTETCSGRKGRYDRVDWYLVNGITGDGLVARARWSEPHEILIVAGYENDPLVVRHEMLHDLLNGDRTHRRTQWDLCGLRFDDNRLGQLIVSVAMDRSWVTGTRPPVATRGRTSSLALRGGRTSD